MPSVRFTSVLLIISVLIALVFASNDFQSDDGLARSFDSPQIPIGKDLVPSEEIIEHIKEIIVTAIEKLQPAIDFVIEHPWMLIPFLIPAFDAWLVALGFGVEGIVASSIAAALQSYIGNVPKGSIFAFLQSNGAGGWARVAVRMGGLALTLAVLLVFVGVLLRERGLDQGDVVNTLTSGWRGIVANWTVPHAPGKSTAIGLMDETGVFIAAGYSVVVWMVVALQSML